MRVLNKCSPFIIGLKDKLKGDYIWKSIRYNSPLNYSPVWPEKSTAACTWHLVFSQELIAVSHCLISIVQSLAVEESANLPPSPPPSPASEQTGTLDEGKGPLDSVVYIYEEGGQMLSWQGGRVSEWGGYFLPVAS